MQPSWLLLTVGPSGSTRSLLPAPANRARCVGRHRARSTAARLSLLRRVPFPAGRGSHDKPSMTTDESALKECHPTRVTTSCGETCKNEIYPTNLHYTPRVCRARTEVPERPHALKTQKMRGRAVSLLTGLRHIVGRPWRLPVIPSGLRKSKRARPLVVCSTAGTLTVLTVTDLTQARTQIAGLVLYKQ